MRRPRCQAGLRAAAGASPAAAGAGFSVAAVCSLLEAVPPAALEGWCTAELDLRPSLAWLAARASTHIEAACCLAAVLNKLPAGDALEAALAQLLPAAMPGLAEDARGARGVWQQ